MNRRRYLPVTPKSIILENENEDLNVNHCHRPLSPHRAQSPHTPVVREVRSVRSPKLFENEYKS